MSERKPMQVNISLDFGPFIDGMNRAAASIRRLLESFLSSAERHRMRHHRRERPEVSAMHAAYDRRRRARRRNR